MNILLSDLHNDLKVLLNLKFLLENKQFDLAVIPGDISNRYPKALNYVQALDKIFKDHQTPWLAVHGNNDPPEVIEFLKSSNKNVHFIPKVIDIYKFIGIGGWGDELPPYQLIFDQTTILVTHIPPFISRTTSLIPISQPLIHIAGHKHQLERVSLFGKTTIINIPSAKTSNRAAILHLPGKKVEFFDLPMKKPLA